MFVPHATGIEAQLKYYKALKQYNENCRKGKGTYREFAKLVGMNLNLVMASAKGYHRDHIVPKSFCRKLGLTPSQTNHPKNLRYMLPQDNIDKFSFMGTEELAHLEIMCKEWEISYPPQCMIDEHNATAAKKQSNLTPKEGKKTNRATVKGNK